MQTATPLDAVAATLQRVVALRSCDPVSLGLTALNVTYKCERFQHEASLCSCSSVASLWSGREPWIKNAFLFPLKMKDLKLIAWHYGLSVLSALILLWQNDGRSLSHWVMPCLWALHSSSGSSEWKHHCDLHGEQFCVAGCGGWGGECRCYIHSCRGADPAVAPCSWRWLRRTTRKPVPGTQPCSPHPRNQCKLLRVILSRGAILSVQSWMSNH